VRFGATGEIIIFMITNFQGLPGAGKTLSMVMQAYRYWKETGVPVYANFSVRFPKNIPKKHDRLSLFENDKLGLWYCWHYDKQEYFYPKVIQGENLLTALLQVDKALILIDEAGTVFDNRSWKEFPKSAMAKFRESRKCQLEIMYTAQDIMDVDLKLRRLTNYVVMCKFERFFGRDLFLRNWAYYSQVIRSDTPASRKEWLAWYETSLWKEFQNYYSMYNTMERIKYDIPSGKELVDLYRPNAFEPATTGVAGESGELT